MTMRADSALAVRASRKATWKYTAMTTALTASIAIAAGVSEDAASPLIGVDTALGPPASRRTRPGAG